MVAILYFLNVVTAAGQSTLSKLHARAGGDADSFNINKAFSGLLSFCILGLIFDLSFHPPTFLLAILYGIFLHVSMYAGFQALALGPMALTSILASFSLVLPMLFGLLFWGEKLSIFGIFGIPLLLAAIILIGFKKEGPLSFRWLHFAFLTMAANGICSIIQKLHQRLFPQAYRFEFMIFAFGTVLVLLFIVSLCKKSTARFSLNGALAGILNGATNYIILLLAALVNASILFPMISITNIIAILLIGTIFFKEKLRRLQILGLAFGIISIILLNL